MTTTLIDFPVDLLNAFETNGGHGVVAFVGSGPSCAAGLYSWSELLRRVAAELELDSEVGEHLRNRDFIRVATFLATKRTEVDIKERVAKQIRLSASRPHKIHELIVILPFAGIITTNYDLLLSDADTTHSFNRPITYKTSGLRDHLLSRFVLHLHGHVDDPETIVITRKGYDHIEFEDKRIQQFLPVVFAAKTVLFIGFGFADQHIDDLLSKLRITTAIGGSTVFALIPSATPTPDGVLHQSLRDQSINPIYMPDTGDHAVASIVDWLSSLNDALSQITFSRQASFKMVKPQLVEAIRLLFLSADWSPFLPNALISLPNRPDLRNMVRIGLTTQDITGLFDRLGVGEMRQVLIILNRLQRSPILEDALSCLPPS